MTKLNYSLEKLRQLMATSTAYQSLSAAEKSSIETHIAQNNKPILLYIYQKLQQEFDSHQISRDQLAEKIYKIKSSDHSDLTKKLRHIFLQK